MIFAPCSSINLGNMETPVLVFGGPYSNFQATQKIQEIAFAMNIPASQVICTGDVVAYCGNPQQTVDLIRQWGCHVVMGNCEESVGFELVDCGCGFDQESLCATLSVDWYAHSLTRVSDDNKSWMRDLPKRIQFTLGGKIYSVIHGGAFALNEFIFHSTAKHEKLKQIKALESDCVIGGHCGIPFGQKIDDGFWLNAGVIGMPANEGAIHTWYMLLQADGETITATWHQLNFDSADTIEAMKQAKLPTPYQQTLQNGIWPSLSILPEFERNQQGQKLQLAPMQIK